ncbi:MAG: DUF4129 domain-containing protein [Armatimonadetes bacterium]|nr:DUF4129 domain-containing protein [Armatimonadota bacterium]
MQHHKRLDNAEEQYRSLGASSTDYMLLAAALAVPLYTSGLAILEPATGGMSVVLCWLGIAVSYMVRLAGIDHSVTRGLGWLMLGLAVMVGANLDFLNNVMPGGGFPWQLAPAAFMCWFIIAASFFLWNDDTMLFLLVPGIALFGVQSYIETAGHFVISLILFMASVAVLLTRLHLRVMYAAARAAGYSDVRALYRGPWRGMAGPTLAVLSVLVVGGSSYFLAPQIGGAVRKLAGEPEIMFRPPRFSTAGAPFGNVSRQIGNGPLTSSNLPVLKVTSSSSFPYLRGFALGSYRGNGWTELGGRPVPLSRSMEKAASNVDRAVVYFPPKPPSPRPGRTVTGLIESLNRFNAIAHVPGPPVRIEYDGDVSSVAGEFLLLARNLGRGREYYVESETNEASAETLRAAPLSDRQVISERYERRSRDRIATQVRDLANRIAASKSTDYDTVIAFMGEIASRCKYNLKAERIEGGKDRVEAFLFETQEGYCDLFASSLTVMCRAVGIQSRAVTGYLVDPASRKGNAYTIRDRDAHMWTEVFFEGIGWVPFDATTNVEEVPGGGVGSLLEEEAQGEGLKWAAWIGGSVLALVALALAIGSLRTFMIVRRTLTADMRLLRPLYTRFLRALQRNLHRPKFPSETTFEYARAYQLSTSNGKEALTLAGAFDRALYSATIADKAELARMKAGVDILSRKSRKNGK